MSQAGRQNETSKKAIAIPGRKRINNQWVWIWEGRDRVTFYFSQLGSGDNLLKENFEGPSWA